MRAMGFGPEVDKKNEGVCPFCNELVNMNDFKDELSKKDFRITGMCQTCQDNFYN